MNYFQDGELNIPQSLSSSYNPFKQIAIYWEAINDKIKNYYYERWGVVIVLFFIFLIRLLITRGIKYYLIY